MTHMKKNFVCVTCRKRVTKLHQLSTTCPEPNLVRISAADIGQTASEISEKTKERCARVLLAAREGRAAAKRQFHSELRDILGA